jgi:hypothetical protein
MFLAFDYASQTLISINACRTDRVRMKRISGMRRKCGDGDDIIIYNVPFAECPPFLGLHTCFSAVKRAERRSHGTPRYKGNCELEFLALPRKKWIFEWPRNVINSYALLHAEASHGVYIMTLASFMVLSFCASWVPLLLSFFYQDNAFLCPW